LKKSPFVNRYQVVPNFRRDFFTRWDKQKLRVTCIVFTDKEKGESLMSGKKPSVSCSYGLEDVREILLHSFLLFLRRELQQTL
jgi:hypothetical protein